MFISHSDLTENAKREYFSNGYFIMEEAYSGTLVIKDNVYKINISMGKYPIDNQKNGLKITFD
ncbi:MAG: hypothetical protein IPL46_12065 [Saprospiraceae bacterium]|nr:hypothetical protein [Saprospiraceae bacterium]